MWFFAKIARSLASAVGFHVISVTTRETPFIVSQILNSVISGLDFSTITVIVHSVAVQALTTFRPLDWLVIFPPLSRA